MVDPDVILANLIVRGGIAPEGVVREAMEKRGGTGLLSLLAGQGVVDEAAAAALREKCQQVGTRLDAFTRGEAASGEDAPIAAALGEGLVTLKDVQRALEIQAGGGDLSLGEILVSRQVLAPDVVARLARGGERRFGKFVVLSELGRGGMGTVYRVREEGTGRELACKVLALASNAPETSIARFRNEARVLASLRHPSLVELYEVGEVGGFLYYTMPVVQGKPLSGFLAERGALPPEEAARLLLPIAEAVAVVHEANLVHRDLKPANVLLLADGNPVLIDFGIARRLEESNRWTRTNQRVGTPAYMSPERILGKRSEEGPPADVWSLGVILFEFLAGRRPFEGRTNAEILTRIARGLPPSFREAAGRDRRLEAILRMALAPDPAHRYPTARLLAEDLERYLAGQTPAAPPVSAGGRLKRLLARNVFALGLVVAGALVLFAPSLFFLGQAESIRQDTAERQREVREAYDAARRDGELERLPGLFQAVRATGSADEVRETEPFDARRAPAFTARALPHPAYRALCAPWEAFVGRRPRIEFLPARDAAGEPFLVPYLAALEREGAPPISAGPGASVAIEAGGGYFLKFAGSGLVPYTIAVPPLGMGRVVRLEPLAVRLSDALPGESVPAALEETPQGWRVVASESLPGSARAASLARLEEMARLRIPEGEAPRIDEPLRLRSARYQEARKALFAVYTEWARQWREAFDVSDHETMSQVAKNLAKAVVALPAADDFARRDIEDARALAGAMADLALRIPEALLGHSGTFPLRPEGQVPVIRVKELRGREVLFYKHPPAEREAPQSLPLARLDLARFLDAIGADWSRVRGVRGEGELPAPEGTRPPAGPEALFLRDLDVLSQAELARQGLFGLKGRAWAGPELRDEAGFGRELPALETAPRPVARVAFSPDGRILAAAEGDAVTLWDVASGRELGRLARHSAPVRALAWEPSGKVLVTGSEDHTILIWEVETREAVRALSEHTRPVSALVFESGGTVLASAADTEVFLWDFPKRSVKRRIPGHSQEVRALAFSPDALTLVTASYYTVKTWDLIDGSALETLFGHTGIVEDVAIEREGKVLGSCARDGTIRLWNLASGEELLVQSAHAGGISSIAFQPGGKLLASAGADQRIRLWDPDSESVTAVLEGHEGPVLAIGFSKDGKLLASAGADRTVRTWDPATGRPIRTFARHLGPVTAAAFGPGSRSILTSSRDGTIKVWDPDGGRLEVSWTAHEGGVAALSRVPGAPEVASAGADGAIRIWDAATGREVRSFTGGEGPIHRVVCSPDGRLLASSGDGPAVSVRELATGRVVARFEGAPGSVEAFAFEPGGARLAIARGDGVSIAEVASGREDVLSAGRGAAALAIAFDPRGRTLAMGGRDGRVRIREVATGRELAAIGLSEAPVASVAFSPDGRFLFSAGADGAVRVSCVATGQEVFPLAEGPGEVGDLVASEDGALLLAVRPGERRVHIFSFGGAFAVEGPR